MKKLNSKQIIRRFAFDEWGGTETVVWNTAQKLIETGNKTEILATKALCSKAKETVQNVPIKRFDYFYPYLNLKNENYQILDKKGGNPYSYQLYKYLLQNSDPDILHCHTMQRIANLVRLVAKKRNIPYVISFHGGFFQVPKSEIKSMMKPLEKTFNYGKFLDIFLGNKRFLQDADGIICVGYEEYLATKEKFPDKISTYLPNGVDLGKFQIKNANDFRKKYDIPTKTKLILCVSRIDYQKNQLKLIELTKTLLQKKYNVHLLLIGPVTSQNYFTKIQQKIAEYNIERNVTVIKGLPSDDPDLINAYRTADCFILPSAHEPFGIVVLEAWASKIPVIAHKVGGLKNLIKDNETGLFFHNNSLEELIAKFENLPAFSEKLTEKAYLEVKEKYSWDKITEKLLAFYQKVITEKTR